MGGSMHCSRYRALEVQPAETQHVGEQPVPTRVSCRQVQGQGHLHTLGTQNGGVLSEAWVQYRTGEGRPYYHKASTGETVWELPPQAVLVEQQWKVYYTGEGRAYYHNATTNQTAWELPAGAELADAVYGGC